MGSFSFLNYLWKLFPEVDLLNDESRNILHSKLGNEQKVVQIFSNHFRNKCLPGAHHAYRNTIITEAKYLNKLFPPLPLKYILDQLEIFQDMRDRREIVLRLIINSKSSKSGDDVSPLLQIPKRANPNNYVWDAVNNNQPTKDSLSFLYYLRKVLPEVDLMNGETQNILHSKLGNEQKVVQILSNYFRNKGLPGAHHSYRSAISTEAKYLNKLFPSLSLKYILDQLEIFQDMRDRREIVLRLIINSKSSKGGDDAAPLLQIPKRANPNNHVWDAVNNNQPIKVRRLSDLAPATVTSRQNFPMRLQQGTKVNRAVGGTESHFTTKAGNYAPFTKSATVTATITSTSVEPTATTSAVSATMKPATLVSTVTSSTVRNFDNDNPNKPDEPDIVASNSEPFSKSAINANYEIPDVTDYFDLPVFNMQFTVARNCTVTSEQSELPNQLPVAKNLTVATNSKVNISANVPEPASTPASVEGQKEIKLEADEMQPAEALPEEALPEEQPRDSQDSNRTELYSPPREMPEPHYTVNVLSPTFIKIRKSLIPEEHQEDEEEQALNLSGTSKLNNGVPKDYAALRQNLFPDDFNANLPSTSKQEQTEINVATPETFNLIKYVSDITSAPERIIKRHCTRLNLSMNQKPRPDLLNMLVDNILTITIDSDDSDMDLTINDYVGSEDEEEGNAEALPLQNGPSNIPFIESKNAAEKVNENKISTLKLNLDTQLVNTLCSMFPEACPKYIRGLCHDKKMNEQVLNDLITIILNTRDEYPKRPKRSPEPEIVPENQFEILKEFLPDADPDYLRMMCDKFEGKPDMVKSFLNEAMEKGDYPTMKDYQRRQQLSAQQKQYTTEFNVENFIKLIPDPHAFFSDPSRNIKLNTSDSHYALVFMRNKFNKLPIRTIQSVFTKNSCNILKTVRDLNVVMNHSGSMMRSVRRPIDMPNSIENIPLLQELAYYAHEKDIKSYLKEMREKEETERQEAKDQGLLKTCICCYDEEVLPRDIYCCANGCEFCKSCILKSSEVRFGEGKLDFPCLMDCSSFFTLQTLQAVLSPKLFSKVAQKKALEEVKAAGIDELESCPFCDFATIPAEGYNIFTCMNPECMKESCRMCKEPSHMPLRCEEIEKDEDVRARTFVENKMTEALLRKCWKCGVKFFKEEGCNKMTCSCGAQMCYVCGQPVTSYKHFNGNGGDRYDLCPLYSDSNVLNKENVLKGAEQAKAEIGNVNLKHDPSTDVNRHYEERKKRFPHDHLLVGQLGQMPPGLAFLNAAPRFVGVANPQVRPHH